MSDGEISYEMTFDAGHRIVGHKGKCARLHGHTYRLRVVATGGVVPPGFVVDFGDIKDLVNEWDHMMLLWNMDDLVRQMGDLPGVVLLRFNPTAENMAEFLANEIHDAFALDTVSVELWETPKCSARYTAL